MIKNYRDKICALMSVLFLFGCTPSSDSERADTKIENSSSTQASSAENETVGTEEESLADAFNKKDPPLPPPAPLLTNVSGRNLTPLNGRWNIVVDEHQLGTRPFLGGPYYKRPSRETGMELVEFSFDARKALDVPGDWNSQDNKLFRYRGVVWYERNLTLNKKSGQRYFLHFDGANYDTNVYVNGQPLGHHSGGYTAFNFDATDLLKDGDNFIVIRIDAELNDATIPTLRSSDFF